MKKQSLSSVVILCTIFTLITGCSKSKEPESSGTASEDSVNVTHNGTIPEGATYEVCLDNRGSDYEEPLTSGQKMPEIQTHDRYTYGDFQYSYHESDGGWNVSLPRDENGDKICKSSDFGVILSYINGKPVVKMNMTFSGMENLVDASSIVIPETVTKLTRTFDSCKNLEKAPVIPETVDSLFFTFEDCRNLTGEIEVNCNPSEIVKTFDGTWQAIKITGTASDETKQSLVDSRQYTPNAVGEITY